MGERDPVFTQERNTVFTRKSATLCLLESALDIAKVTCVDSTMRREKILHASISLSFILPSDVMCITWFTFVQQLLYKTQYGSG